MNKIIGLMFIFLTGCVNLSFDALEFDRYLTISETSTLANKSCGTVEFISHLNKLKSNVDHQVSYSNNRSNGRPQISTAATELKSMVDELYNKYQSNTEPSLEYCKQKTTNIGIGSTILVKELGQL